MNQSSAGLLYLVMNVKCTVCTHRWVAVCETPFVYLLGVRHYKVPTKLECPVCQKLRFIKNCGQLDVKDTPPDLNQ